MNRNTVKNEKLPQELLVKHEPFSTDEIADIQRKLEKKLGPEYVSTRPGGGGVRVSYIEGWKAINLANQVFGFNCWNSDVKAISIDFMDERQGRYSVGLSVTVRVTLKDGSYHEDIGYGSIENSKSKAQAFEKAKKEAMTDGLKRALRHFGNALGNCLYDKEYLSKISGVKCAPPDFDESQLMRYADHTNGPSRSNTTPVQSAPYHQQQQQPVTNTTLNSKPFNESRPIHPVPQTIPEKRTIPAPSNNGKRITTRDPDDFDDSLTFSDDLIFESEDFNDEVNELLSKPKNTTDEGEPTANTSNSTIEAHPTNEESSKNNQPNETIIPAEVGFFKARVAEDVQKNNTSINENTAFNPQFISPSIRRTVDPTKSTPIKRPQMNDKTTVRYDSPSLIPNRQIGKPRYPPPRKARVDPPDQGNSA